MLLIFRRNLKSFAIHFPSVGALNRSRCLCVPAVEVPVNIFKCLRFFPQLAQFLSSSQNFPSRLSQPSSGEERRVARPPRDRRDNPPRALTLQDFLCLLKLISASPQINPEIKTKRRALIKLCVSWFFLHTESEVSKLETLLQTEVCVVTTGEVVGADAAKTPPALRRRKRTCSRRQGERDKEGGGVGPGDRGDRGVGEERGRRETSKSADGVLLEVLCLSNAAIWWFDLKLQPKFAVVQKGSNDGSVRCQNTSEPSSHIRVCLIFSAH